MAAPPALHCLVITPEEQVLEATATSIVIPAHDGQVGILANHAPLLCELGTGVLRVDAVGAGWREFCVDRGFAQVLNNEVVVLTERAAAGEDLAKADMQREVSEAEKMPAKGGEAVQVRDHAIRLAKARLRVAKK
jgi:F-type H+-transporting ATPase subunit epsilon